MIRVASEGPVTRITLARPGQRNALTPEMLHALAAALADPSPGTRGILLQGEGRVFCAGFDLDLCAASPDGAAMRALLRGLDAAIRAMRAAPGPVVVACQGAAIAGGCALLAGADFVVADRGAKLGYPVVLLGVSPAVSAPTLAPRMGFGPARSRLLDPGLITGEMAGAMGLVSDVMDGPEDVLPAAERLVLGLASKPPLALTATKRWLVALESTGSLGAEALEASLALAGGAEEGKLLRAHLTRRGR